jgi:hypothetical protein
LPFTVNGFSYTVAVGPFHHSIYSVGGTPAAPGYVWWEITVIVHNGQTDREAPLGPAYSSIDSVGATVPCPNPQASCNGVGLADVAPSGVGEMYIVPGGTIQINYESDWPLPQTLNPSSIKWIFVTDPGVGNPTGPQLNVPS